MWGNYIGAYLTREEFYPSIPMTAGWNWFEYYEDWYNPGFLRDIHNISDMPLGEIFSTLTSSTDTINKLVNSLKNKTIYDYLINQAYEKHDDWP